MGLFGKILLFVNLLAVGGFAFLAVQDWRGRQAITASGIRHILALEGIPLEGGPDAIPPRVPSSDDNYMDFVSDPIPFEVIGPGSVKTTSVSPELLYKYFEAAGEPVGSSLAGTIPVASQMAEVKRVWTIIKAAIDKAEGNAAKAQFAGAWLLNQAETIEERADYNEWIAKGNGAELTHALDIKFHRVAPKLVEAAALNPDLWGSLDSRIKALEAERETAKKAAADAEAAGNAAEAEKKKAEAGALTRKIDRRRSNPPKDNDATDLRRRISHLLVHLDQAASWQKRTALIVGLKEYVKSVDSQGSRFKEMLDRVERGTVSDQERFVGEYGQLRVMAIERTRLVLQMAEVRAQLTIQAQKDQDLVNQRTLQLNDLIAQRTAVRAEVNDLLAKQTLVEQQLFAIEREIALKLEDIYRMETELRKRERDRYERKK